jgi:hypothetical protein
MLENTAVKTTPPISVPRWIFMFGILLTGIGMGAGLLGVFAPTVFFNDFPQCTDWDQISYITTGWGIRNLGMGVAMIVALSQKSPSAIGVVFTMRFVTEAGDLLNALTTGHGSMGLPLIGLAAGWILIFLVPEAFAAKWGLFTAMESKAKNL